MITGLLTLQTPRTDAPEAVRGALPLCGAAWVERMLRTLSLSGADRLILMADRLTPDLTLCLDRCRAAGHAFELVGSAHDLTQRIDRGETILLVEEGVIAEPALVTTLVRHYGGNVQTRGLVAGWPVSHPMADERYRLGQAMTSAGLAILPAAVVTRVARGLGDWDPVQTLIQTALREDGAELLDLSRLPAGVTTLWRRLETVRDADAATAAIASHTPDAPLALVDRWTLEPLVRALMPVIVLVPLRTQLMTAAVAIIGLLGAICLLAGWLRIGAVLTLAGCVAGDLARRVQSVRMDGASERALLHWLRLAVLALAGIGYVVATPGPREMVAALVGWLGVVLGAQAMVVPILAADGAAQRLLAAQSTPWGLALLLCIGAMAGFPAVALAGAAVWASAMLLAGLRSVLTPKSGPES